MRGGEGGLKKIFFFWKKCLVCYSKDLIKPVRDLNFLEVSLPNYKPKLQIYLELIDSCIKIP